MEIFEIYSKAKNQKKLRLPICNDTKIKYINEAKKV